MLRPTHPNHPFTARSQRRGAVIVALVFLLLAAAITFTLTRLDRVPVQNPAPNTAREVATLREERRQLEAIAALEATMQRSDRTAAVTLGW